VRALLALALDVGADPKIRRSAALRVEISSARASRGASHERLQARRPVVAIALLIALGQASKNAVSASLRLGEVREVTAFSTLCWRTTGARRSASSRRRRLAEAAVIWHRGSSRPRHVVMLARHSGERLFSRAWR